VAKLLFPAKKKILILGYKKTKKYSTFTKSLKLNRKKEKLN